MCFEGLLLMQEKATTEKKEEGYTSLLNVSLCPQLTVDKDVGGFMYSLSELLMSSIITSEVLR